MDGPVVYRLRFFCRADEVNAEEALGRLLDELLATGPLLGEWLGPYAEGVATYSLATSGPGSIAVADWLTVELHLGVAEIADTVISADPDCERGIWGCDLLATISLSGDAPDWRLVARIWWALGSM